MSIATEITRLQKAKADIKSAIENKGVTVGNDNLSTYASKIAQISSGSNVLTYAPEYVKFEGYTGDNGDSLTKGLSTSNVTDMYLMFAECVNLKSLNLINFDTQNVKDMSRMFYKSSSLESVNLSSFETKNVTNMSLMFRECSNLTSLDLSSFDTTNVTDMSYMFYQNKSLTTLDLSNFDGTNVTTMAYMFYGCTALTSLDLSGFGKISKTSSFGNMFDACTNLKFIDMRNITFRVGASTTNMFRSVPTDCLIIVKDDTAKTWITGKFSTLTNVKTVAEYEAGL